MKKKLVSGILAGVMLLSMTACGGTATNTSNETTEAPAESAPSAESTEAAAESTEAAAESTEKAAENAEASSDSDVEYIKEKGNLIVGITDFAPMDYKDDSGNWIGFDADLATKVAEDLGVEVQFIEIDWDNKILELDNKSIDVVWNGMTLTDEVKASMNCSNAYLNNAQVVVLPIDKVDSYKDAASLADLNIAVEAGSAGESAAVDNNLNYTAVSAQSDAVMEVAAGTSDACIIDLLMADAMIGQGTSYENLTFSISLTSEEYVVGCRQGSDLTDYINSEFVKFEEDGTLGQIADTYSLTSALVAQK